MLTEYVALRVVSLATRNLCIFLACQKFAHPLLTSTGPSARAIANRAFPALTLSFGTCTSDETSAWCDHPNACSGSLGRQYLVGSIEATRLLHNSVLTSHLLRMMQPSKCIENWLYVLAHLQLTVVYAENQDESITTHGWCFFRACQLIAHPFLNLCARARGRSAIDGNFEREIQEAIDTVSGEVNSQCLRALALSAAAVHHELEYVPVPNLRKAHDVPFLGVLTQGTESLVQSILSTAAWHSDRHGIDGDVRETRHSRQAT